MAGNYYRTFLIYHITYPILTSYDSYCNKGWFLGWWIRNLVRESESRITLADHLGPLRSLLPILIDPELILIFASKVVSKSRKKYSISKFEKFKNFRFKWCSRHMLTRLDIYVLGLTRLGTLELSDSRLINSTLLTSPAQIVYFYKLSFQEKYHFEYFLT